MSVGPQNESLLLQTPMRVSRPRARRSTVASIGAETTMEEAQGISGVIGCGVGATFLLQDVDVDFHCITG